MNAIPLSSLQSPLSQESTESHHELGALTALPRIIPGITTSSGGWREQIESLCALGVSDVALFPTTLSDMAEREEMYAMVEARRHWLRVPVVHLRDDMERSEVERILTMGAKVMNLHATPCALRFVQENLDLAKMICVENQYKLDAVYFEMLDLYCRACIDLAHLEDFGFRQGNTGYDQLIPWLTELKVGMTHIAAIQAQIHETPSGDGKGIEMAHEEHRVEVFPDELEYLCRPELRHVMLWCPWNCVELTNPVSEQLQFIQYIEKNIFGC